MGGHGGEMGARRQRHSLLALVGVGLGDGFGQLDFKLVGAQRHLLVVRDESEEAGECHHVRQVEPEAASLLVGVDKAVLDLAGSPSGWEEHRSPGSACGASN